MIDWEKRKEELFDMWFDDMLDKIIEQEKEIVQEFALKFLEFNPSYKNRSDAYKINKLLLEYKIEEI